MIGEAFATAQPTQNPGPLPLPNGSIRGRDRLLQTGVLRQAEDVVDPLRFAPEHQLILALSPHTVIRTWGHASRSRLRGHHRRRR